MTAVADTTTQIRVATTPAEIHAARSLVHRVNLQDLGYGYDPVWHRDLDLAYETYVLTRRNLMLVAVADGQVLACGGLRVGFPQTCLPLRQRYPDPRRVLQVVRVATDPRARRQGLARRVVEQLIDAARRDHEASVLYLHTNARYPGAVDFWTALGGRVVLDERDTSGDPRLSTVHLEIPLRRA